MTLTWMIAGAAIGLLAGPRARASAFAGSTDAGQPPRRECPSCSSQILSSRARLLSMIPVSGRCPACKARIGRPPLTAELTAAAVLAALAARVPFGWELAALAWLALLAVPLSLIDIAVHRLPDRLTTAAFAGTLALLAVDTLTGHQPGRLARSAAGAVGLACFYLALCLIRPGEMGLGDAKLAASIGLVLAWTSWQALLTGTLVGFALAAVYGGVRLATHRAKKTTQLPLGPFILFAALAVLVLLTADGALPRLESGASRDPKARSLVLTSYRWRTGPVRVLISSRTAAVSGSRRWGPNCCPSSRRRLRIRREALSWARSTASAAVRFAWPRS